MKFAQLLLLTTWNEQTNEIVMARLAHPYKMHPTNFFPLWVKKSSFVLLGIDDDDNDDDDDDNDDDNNDDDGLWFPKQYWRSPKVLLCFFLSGTDLTKFHSFINISN